MEPGVALILDYGKNCLGAFSFAKILEVLRVQARFSLALLNKFFFFLDDLSPDPTVVAGLA